MGPSVGTANLAIMCAVARRVLAICGAFALLLTFGCARTPYGNHPGEARVTPLPPSPNPYLTYLALDYGKPGQPALTAQEIAQIREALALVKPCQLTLVRYAFPAGSGVHLILFFQAGPHGASSHPFGQSSNSFYEQETGTVSALPAFPNENTAPRGIQYDIANTPCTPPSVPRASALQRLRSGCRGPDPASTVAYETRQMNFRLHFPFLRGYRVWRIDPEHSSVVMVATPFETAAVAERSAPSRYITLVWDEVFSPQHAGCGYIDKWVAFVTAKGKELFTLYVQRTSY
jgi:hypothetical protein